MELHNWAGNVRFTATQLHRPTTVEELQHVVKTTPRVRALGTGHSFNTIADSPTDLISLADLAVPVEIDSDARVAEVGGGVTFAYLAATLHEQGWALPNLGSLPHIAVAGAFATGTHGSGNANRCLATTAVAVEFVNGDGELVRRSRQDADFGGSVLALGALGVVTRLWLGIVPAFDVRQDVWLDAPFAAVRDNVAEVMAAGYSVSAFSTFARPDVVDQIWVKSRPEADRVDWRGWGARPATEAQHPVPGQDAVATTEQMGHPGPWHTRLPHFRAEFKPSSGDEQQSEFLLPREHAAAALDAVRGVDLRAALQVFELRTVAADELWLSPFHGRDTVALHFTWYDDDALVHAAVRALEDALAPFDARPHWGKVFTRSDVAAHYPRLGDFRALAAQHDPQRRFGNDFLERWVY